MRKTPDIDMCKDVHTCNTHIHIHTYINTHTEAEYKNVSLASILLEDFLLVNVFMENTDIYSISAQE